MNSLILTGFLRAAAAIPFWLLRGYLEIGGEGAVPTGPMLLLDTILVSAHVFALVPIARSQDEQFPTRRRKRNVLVVPFVIALALLVRDITFWWSGRAI